MNKEYRDTEEWRLSEGLKEVLMHHDLTAWTPADIKITTDAADYLHELAVN